MKQAPPQTVLVDNNLLFQIFALTSYCAADNLRKVANALSQKDEKTLDLAAPRNEKIPRLCQEMEQQVMLQLAEPDVPEREKKKILLLMKISAMLQRMGDQTVEVASLSKPLLTQPRSSQIMDLKKLLEHAVYLTDKMATGFLQEKDSSLQAAFQENESALTLYQKFQQENTGLSPEHDSLGRIADQAHAMTEQSVQMAHEVEDFLQTPKI